VPARSSSRLSFIAPQLATLVSEPPAGEEWLHEVKFDGYRMECLIAGGRARLLTRRGLDWTARFPRVAELAAGLPAAQAILDGEVVALLPDGRSSFQALQQSFLGEAARQVVYYAFDLLRLDHEDLRPLPLEDRKRRLARLLKGRRHDRRGTLRYSDHVAASGATVLAKACKMGLEGIVSKRRDLSYQSGRSRSWLKTKCLNRQELIVIGFTDPRGGRQGIGALLLGVYSAAGELQYAGKVGTGMNEAMLRTLRAALEPLRRADAPVRGKTLRGLASAHWVEPRLVVEVEFTEWTDDGRLRHPSFVGIREDKAAREVRRELPA
jgi:bifunctional non-homologous end joining protein LigD